MQLKFRHKETGREFVSDSEAMRYSRLRRRVTAWAMNADAVRGFRVKFIMVTLTYTGVDDWRPNHIREFMKRVKRYAGRKLIGYAWVAELQQRGAMHYHVLLAVRMGTVFPMPDKAGWWRYGSTRIETARTKYYIVKYAQKGRFKHGDEWVEFPKGARIFAVWLSSTYFSPVTRWIFRLSVLPAWLSEFLLSSPTLLMARWARNWRGGWRIETDIDHGMGRAMLVFSPWVVIVDRRMV